MNRRSTLFVIALVAALSGCASDDPALPEPTVETPGAFIAEELAPGDVRLLRTLAALAPQNTPAVLFVTVYEPHVSSFEEARELARQKDIPTQQVIAAIVRSELEQKPVEVVWFRSLEQWEVELVH